MRQQTWFATVVCTIAVIPAFLIGALFEALMYVFGGWAEGADFLYLSAIVGFETPGTVYHFIFGEVIHSEEGSRGNRRVLAPNKTAN